MSSTPADTGANLDPALHAHGDTHGHGSRRSYLTGFALSVVLTAIPFWLVMADPIGNPGITAAAVVVLAVLQILVHTIFFLHVDTRGEGGWTLIAFVFAAVILFITIAGSMWIMYHLNSNMMPGMMTEQSSAAP